VTDLSNDLALCEEWDHARLRSPAQPETPTPVELPKEVPIAQAMPLAVSIPTSVTARTDGCIDDLVRVFLDTATNREREPHAVPLAIHVTSRPHAGDSEPLSCIGPQARSRRCSSGITDGVGMDAQHPPPLDHPFA
jgi:hypothetical protein